MFLESSLKEGHQNTRSHLPRIILFALQGTKLQTIYMNALFDKRDKHFIVRSNPSPSLLQARAALRFAAVSSFKLHLFPAPRDPTDGLYMTAHQRFDRSGEFGKTLSRYLETKALGSSETKPRPGGVIQSQLLLATIETASTS